MATTKTLGGDRLGAGKKMQVHLHGFERSTHDLSYIFRTTMASGTLVPFMKQVALPGDTFDINLDCKVLTHPTVGPLFGSYKVQLDVFFAPVRLYNRALHDNMLGIGMNMKNIYMPVMPLKAWLTTKMNDAINNGEIEVDNVQINPSALLSYLGIRGIGMPTTTLVARQRNVNATPALAYWDIFKNYYANKQEKKAFYIHTENKGNMNVENVVITATGNLTPIPKAPTETPLTLVTGDRVVIESPGHDIQEDQIALVNDQGTEFRLSDRNFFKIVGIPGKQLINYEFRTRLVVTEEHIVNWKQVETIDPQLTKPGIQEFDLEELDRVREAILGENTIGFPFTLSTLRTGGHVSDNNPLVKIWDYPTTGTPEDVLDSPYRYSQEGLALKTYQSDLYNNWVNTEWIDGANGIAEITKIDTSGGAFTLDTLNLSKKVYNMLNRVAVSGGSYYDWLEAVYDHDKIRREETPIYCGGLSKELIFDEVINNSAAETPDGPQPLGSLAGRGTMSQKHKGGKIRIRVDEPGYIIGIVSLTPRLDYSQGNDWDIDIATMDDFHKPNLDEIGFQERITENMLWADTTINAAGIHKRSAGKQPAWINYMTNVNVVRGNFAIQSNEMFMTLNRRYEYDHANRKIKDLTTYIDPEKFNHIFAQTELDSQNFWTQIKCDITARRKMSARIMPNL